MDTSTQTELVAPLARYYKERNTITVIFEKGPPHDAPVAGSNVVLLTRVRGADIIGFRIRKASECVILRQRWSILSTQPCRPLRVMSVSDILDTIREDPAYKLDPETFQQLKSRSAGLECDLTNL